MATKKTRKCDLDKHCWEGWRVRDYVEHLEPMLDNIFSDYLWGKKMEKQHPSVFENCFEKPMTKEELKSYCKNNLPYINKHIPDVYNYFLDRYDY